LFSDRWEKKFVYVYISILNQPVHALTPFCSILNQEAVNINFIAFGLTGLRLEPTL
jgi:hypothetical protein